MSLLLRSDVRLVYLASLLQGLTLVSFPSSGTVLRESLGLSAAVYGGIFLPQTAMAIVGSLVGGRLSSQLGLRWLLVLSCLFAAASQLALLGASLAPGLLVAPVLYLGTGFLGLGFGIAAAPLNSYPALLFPERKSNALVALHSVMGLGLSLGPILVGLLIALNAWGGFPVIVICLGIYLGVAARSGPLPEDRPSPGVSTTTGDRPSFAPLALFGAIAVLYALAEGTFSNWASIFLHDARGVEASIAALAVSSFWGALTVGRLLAAASVGRVPPERLWMGLPLAMAAVLLLLPWVAGPASGIGLFFFAGLACSAFFPLSVDLASRRYPGREPLVSSLLVAALMVGVGGGSFLLGALQSLLSFEALYRLSALYPLLAFGLGWVALRGTESIAPTTREN